MTDKTNIAEVSDMTNQNKANDPVAKGKLDSKRIADNGGAAEPMPTLDTKNGPSSKAEVIMYTADYIAGLTNDNALEFFNKIAAEIKAKDATYTGGTRASTTAMGSLMTHKEDLDLVFASDESLSEEFKSKASTIFEAAVKASIIAETAKLEEAFDAKLEEVSETVKEELNTRVTSFIDYVAEKWLEQNKLAVEASIRTEAADTFLSGLKNLFAESYIDIPADKVNVVESLAAQNDILESQINDETSKNVEAKKTIESLELEINTLKAAAVLESSLDGLTDVQKEKVRSLVGVYEGGSLDDFSAKITTISETVVSAPAKMIKEDSTIDPVDAPAREVAIDPDMKMYVDFMKRFK
jgi:hypothetical protein